MPILNFVILLFLFLATNINQVFAEECILADDMGDNFHVVVPAKPSLSHDGGFSQGATSQRAVWTDSGLFTNGDGFYFEIEGMWTPWYGSIKTADGRSMMAAKNAFCLLETENRDAERMDAAGEFDYINSSYYIKAIGSGDNISYAKYNLDSSVQIPCWLTAGEGLYVAFFGSSGEELPQVATHLKSAEIYCEPEYATDKNGDGIVTLNECYEILKDEENKKSTKSENKAYYKPYISESLVAGVRCDKDNYHPSRSDGYIGINDCYTEVFDKNNRKIKQDKTIFTYKVPYFYKTPTKTKVGIDERMKFIIYDRYYKDNVGEYIINIFGGATDMADRGLIERILTDLENVFIGNRDDRGNLNGGILQQFYNYIVGDSIFALTLRTFIILYMAFLGLQFAMGSLEYKTKELMKILLKLAFILGFTTTTSWKMYDRYIVSFFFDGFSSIITMIANIASRLYEMAGIGGGNVSSKFAFIDTLVLSLFSDSVTKKIQGLFFGAWFGFIVIPVMYGLIIYYIYKLVNAIFPYIIMFIQAVVALALGPIFISFYLFKTTEYMFKNWLAFVGARFANMAFLFLFLFSFASIIRAKFMELLYFEVCKIPLWQAVVGDTSTSINSAMSFFSFGIKVWDAKWTEAHPEPSFFGFCVDLLFLFLLIWLFGLIMKKVPSVVDNLIDIGGEGGGKNKDLIGKNAPTFTEAIDENIKISAPDAKGKMQSAGFFKGAGMYVKRGAKLANEYTFKAAGKAIKNAIAGDINTVKNIDNINEKGEVGIKMAGEDYRKKLLSSGMNSDRANAKVQKYEDHLREKYAKAPIEKYMRQILNDFQRDFQKAREANPNVSFDSKEFDGMMNSMMKSYVRDRFGADSVEAFGKFYEKSPITAAFKTGMVGKSGGGANFDTKGFARGFMVRNALGRIGLKSTGNFADDYNLYQRAVANKVNKGTFGKNNSSGEKGTPNYTGQPSGISRKREAIRYNRDKGYAEYDTTKETLTRTAESIRNGVIASMKQQYRELPNLLLENRKKTNSLIDELENKKLLARSAKIDSELARLDRLNKHDFTLGRTMSDRVQEQIFALQAEKKRNSEMIKLREELKAAKLAADKNKIDEIKGKMKELGPSNYRKLALESHDISSKYADYLKKTHSSSLGYSGLYKSGKNGELLLNNEAIDLESKRLKELMSQADIDKDTKERIESTIKSLGDLVKIEDEEKLRNIGNTILNDIQAIDDKVLGESDILSRLDVNDRELSSLANEIAKFDAEYQTLLNTEAEIREQSEAMQTYKQDEKGEIVVDTGNKNMVLEGLDAATFGGEGIAGDLGIGSSSVEELLGFGDGAGSLVMGKDFISEDEAAKKADTDEDILNRARLKMSKQQVKILKFQLAQAEAAGADPKEIQRIKDELKDNERQVKIIEDDIQES